MVHRWLKIAAEFSSVRYNRHTLVGYNCQILVGCNCHIFVGYIHCILVGYNCYILWSKFEKYSDIIWKTRWVRVVNGVSREVPRPRPEGPQAPRVLAAGLLRGTPFTILHPRLFQIMSFFGHPGLVKRDIFIAAKPNLYHTQSYVIEVQTFHW